MRAPGRWATACRCLTFGSAGFCDRPHRLLFEVEHNDDNETETDLFQQHPMAHDRSFAPPAEDGLKQVDPLACARPSPSGGARAASEAIRTKREWATQKRPTRLAGKASPNQATEVPYSNAGGSSSAPGRGDKCSSASRDYQVRTRRSEAGIELAMSHLLRKRIK